MEMESGIGFKWEICSRNVCKKCFWFIRDAADKRDNTENRWIYDIKYLKRGLYDRWSFPSDERISLDKNGEIKHAEKMDKEDSKIYVELQSEIKEAVEKMNRIYSEFYK